MENNTGNEVDYKKQKLKYRITALEAENAEIKSQLANKTKAATEGKSLAQYCKDKVLKRG